MQFRVALRILGLLLMVFSTTMLPPLAVAWWYGDGGDMDFIHSFLLTAGSGFVLWALNYNARRELRLRDGFVIVMGPGADYRSPNYRFFSERHELFTYVDRIAVAPAAQGRGVGRLLYDLVVGHAARQGSPFVCAEVNLEPPNPDSLAFHHSMGFVDAGTQWTYDDTVQVQLLERPVDRSEPRHDRHGEAPAGSVG